MSAAARKIVSMAREGFLRPPAGLTPQELLDIERFAHKTGIGPIFDHRPRHHAQHDHCCDECNTYRQQVAQRKRTPRQPWAAIELSDAA
jgi:hypothetical protein